MTWTFNGKGEEIGTVQSVQLTLHTTVEELEKEWLFLQVEDQSLIYQTYEWVRIAFNTLEKNTSPLIICGWKEDRIQFILPLVAEKTGLITTIRWIGRTHVNIGGGLYSKQFLANLGDTFFKMAFKQIAKSVSGPKLLRLNNQLFDLPTGPNPMLSLPKQTSVNHFFEMDISKGIDAVLELGNAKRKRKLYRRQVRVGDDNGGSELFIPQTEEEINASIDDFLIQKAARFKEMGVEDVFADDGTRDFLRQLALAPMQDGVQPLRIFELRIGGKTRAMYGCGIHGDYCQSCINSVTYDDLAHISPGEMVLYMMIEHLVEEGFDKFDLGVGDERYKISWCRTATDLFDTISPLSVSVIPIMFAMKSKLKLKAFIRGNNVIWPYFKKMRKKVAKLKN